MAFLLSWLGLVPRDYFRPMNIRVTFVIANEKKDENIKATELAAEHLFSPACDVKCEFVEFTTNAPIPAAACRFYITTDKEYNGLSGVIMYKSDQRYHRNIALMTLNHARNILRGLYLHISVRAVSFLSQ